MKSTVAEAIGYALKDLGVDVVTHVPGHGASEAFISFNEKAMKRAALSYNEEPAYSIAHGSAIAGKRSASMIKSHGFVKAGNAAVDSQYTELSAGFVIFIFEDKQGSHSDNILEIEPILRGMYFPYFIAKKETIYYDIVKSYEESERRGIPVALLIDSEDVERETEYEYSKNLRKTFNYKRDVLKHVVSPIISEYQFKLYNAKKLDMHAANFEKPKLPNVPDELPDRYQESIKKYIPFFDSFNNFRGDIVTGDTSVSSNFAFPPYNSIDMVTHIGGSISLAIGAYLAGFRNVWAVTGDFGFLSSGYLGLLEAVQRELPLKIIILYNKEASATGGQLINKKLLMRMLAGFERFVKHINDPFDPVEINEVLSETADSDEMKIIVVNY